MLKTVETLEKKKIYIFSIMDIQYKIYREVMVC